MKRYLLVFWIVLWTLLGATTATALEKGEIWNVYREAETSFRRANELLGKDPEKARELFEKALISFQAIHQEGGIENGRLYYNIANTYFRLGDVGRAILNYRRAERFIPNDVNLQQNLNYARSRCIDTIELKPQTQVLRTVFFWHYDLTSLTRSWLFATFFAFLWLFAGLYLRRRKPWLRYALMCCALPSLLLTASLGFEAYEQSHIQTGVVLDSQVVARKGDSTVFEPTFKDPLHTGVEFQLVEARKGWLHIELADGRRCWIPESAAGMT
jgi:tetratricopeptide (TPR) repeat protein